MRSEKEIVELILKTAKADDRVRVVGMNGSRTNANAPKDEFQDYDIVYVVTDMSSYLESPAWIDVFGKRIMLQMPEAMSLFPPTLGNWFSYLMLFEDGNRIDLTLVPLDELPQYIQSDKLTKILLDKDGRVPNLPIPTDSDYWVKKPNENDYQDCCNEFWWLSTYVVKGLCRNELPYAVDHLNMMRHQLYTMLSWQVGVEIDFSASMGKNFKYLKNYLPLEVWEQVMRTYQNSTNEAIWDSLWRCLALFRKTSNKVAQDLRIPYPIYDEKVTPYLKNVYAKKYE